MKQKTISQLKQGEYFKFSENGAVMVRSHYDRSSRTYAYYHFDDVNRECFAKGTRKVITEFEF